MTRKLRAIIFWLIFALFLVISPLALLYALDYSYDWQNKKLIQNGGFYLKSSPKSASIYLNDKYKKTTPRFIKKLFPKTYSIKIEKEGFYPWVKELFINSGLVTESKYALLINKNPELELVGAYQKLDDLFPPSQQNNKKERVEKIIISSFIEPNAKISSAANIQKELTNYHLILSANHYAAIIRNASKNSPGNNQKGALYLLNNDDNFIKLSENVVNAQFSSDNKKLLWQTDANEIWAYWLDDDYTQPYKKAGDKNLITRFNEKIEQAIWYDGDNQHVIFTIGDAIKIIEIDDRNQKNIFDIATIQNPQILSKNKTLYILSNGMLYKTRLENGFEL